MLSAGDAGILDIALLFAFHIVQQFLLCFLSILVLIVTAESHDGRASEEPQADDTHHQQSLV